MFFKVTRIVAPETSAGIRGKTYDYSVSETQTTVHGSDAVEVTPATVHPFNPLWVRSKFHKSEAELYKGSELYSSPSSDKIVRRQQISKFSA